jgi:hypothetical protein
MELIELRGFVVGTLRRLWIRLSAQKPVRWTRIFMNMTFASGRCNAKFVKTNRILICNNNVNNVIAFVGKVDGLSNMYSLKMHSENYKLVNDIQ